MDTPSIAKFTKAKPTTLAEATEVIWHKTPIRMYGVSEPLLDELMAGYNSLSLVFFGVCSGAALTLGIACRQTTATAPEKPYYVIGCMAATLLAVFFGLYGIGNYRKVSAKKKKLYRESVPIEK
jgi:hypothetical protein